jgi:hypothetical protein
MRSPNHKQIVRPEVAVDNIIAPQPESLLASDQIGEARKYRAGGRTVPPKRVTPARHALKNDRQDIRRPIRLAGYCSACLDINKGAYLRHVA